MLVSRFNTSKYLAGKQICCKYSAFLKINILLVINDVLQNLLFLPNNAIRPIICEYIKVVMTQSGESADVVRVPMW